MFKKLLKIGKGILGGILGGSIPVIAASQIDDSMAQAILYVIGGVTGSTATAIGLGFEFLGASISYFGRMYYGKEKWENEIEPELQKALRSTDKGLDKDDEK